MEGKFISETSVVVVEGDEYPCLWFSYFNYTEKLGFFLLIYKPEKLQFFFSFTCNSNFYLFIFLLFMQVFALKTQ